jgi:hypothetical protein
MNDAIDLENDAPQAEPIAEELFAQVSALEGALRDYKKQLYSKEVATDQDHEAEDLGAMYQYHGLLLQSIAYWIGLLDSVKVPAPKLEEARLQTQLENVTRQVEALHESGTDGRTLTYNILYKLSIEHPFYFPQPQQELS